ncbi:hypothetical protein VM1G_01612 [Cytospora mali]|uniref:Uncharacterized protein n=1 Tax=Cytospora mali TaxID=578113 RepID=A0A194VQL6_CYTMA|nr:hypothetical protein VM1G_01612 [Valsa mali]
MYRGEATRCSLKHSGAMIALRLVAPLTMRDENRQRRKYIKEQKRYRKYLEEEEEDEEEELEQRVEQETAPHADSDIYAPPPPLSPPLSPPPANTTDGTTDEASPAEEASSWFKRCGKRLCAVVSTLKPKKIFRRPARPGKNDTASTMEPPRYMPHWHHPRPKPTPAWAKIGTETEPPGPHPYGHHSRTQRICSRSTSPYRNRSVMSEDARAYLAARRRRSQDRTAGTRVVNREDMPKQYRQTNPY